LRRWPASAAREPGSGGPDPRRHGDLLADDIFCLPDGPRAGCLEFDDGLRTVDGLDDAACLAMDLERLGSANLASRFVAWFAEFSGEARVDSLIHHYNRLSGRGPAEGGLLRWARGIRRRGQRLGNLAQIALRTLCAPGNAADPGRRHTGDRKSTLAAGLADELGAVLLRSDRIRKEGNDLTPEPRAAEPWRSGLYAPAVTEALHTDLISRAGLLLENGESVIIDASWSRAAVRDQARSAAAATLSPIVELRCCAPVDIVDARIGHRGAGDDPSDATTPELARLMEQAFETWPEAEELRTTRSAAEVLERATGLVAVR
jgi:predicted kinase